MLPSPAWGKIHSGAAAAPCEWADVEGMAPALWLGDVPRKGPQCSAAQVMLLGMGESSADNAEISRIRVSFSDGKEVSDEMGTAAFPPPTPFCQSVFSSKCVIWQAEKRRENIKVSYQNWLGIFPEILKMFETNCNRNRGISSAFLTEDKKNHFSSACRKQNDFLSPKLQCHHGATEPPIAATSPIPWEHPHQEPPKGVGDGSRHQCSSQTHTKRMKRDKNGKERDQ